MVGTRAMMVLALAACVTPAAPVPATRPALRGPDPYRGYPDITATGTKQFAAPDASARPPLFQIGQRVVYKRRDKSGVALETLHIVARDECGVWFERSINQHGMSTTWLFCVSRYRPLDFAHPEESLSAVVERRNREVVLVAPYLRVGSEAQRQYGWLVSLVAPVVPTWDDPVHEDVATPLGLFHQATKLTITEGRVTTTRWSHPAVPIGGVVKEVTADYERVLVEFGISDGGDMIVEVMEDLELAQRSFRQINDTGTWVALRVGLDSLGTMTDLNGTYGFGSSFGIPVTSSLDVATSVTAVGDAASTIDPMLGESMMLVGGGVRWYPLGRSRPGRSGPGGLDRIGRRALLYTQADVSYVQLWRSTPDGDETTVGRGVAIGAKLGINIGEGRDWSLGFEVHDDLALLNGDEGLRNSFGVQCFIQLFGRPMGYPLPW